LSAPGAITISSNSLFDVTGGGWLHANGIMASSDMGKGGNLSFLGDTDPYLSGNNPALAKNELKPVQFNGTFLAYGMGGNGTLVCFDRKERHRVEHGLPGSPQCCFSGRSLSPDC
jgi:hypothetical protein